jgi:hypothetical protein
MTTTNCPSCSKQIPEASSFCPFCAVPVKCKACGEIWLKEAVACFQCGAKIDAVASTQASNSIQFEQNGKNRKLTAYFSDSVGVQLSGVLSGLVSGQPPEYRPLQPPGNGATRKPLSIPPTSPYVQDAVIDSSSDEGLLSTLGKVFREEGEQLVVHDQRLKHTSQLDFAKRLTILFLYAHQLKGKQLVARTALNAILMQEKVYDGNTRYWLTKAEEIQVKEDGHIELRPAGVDKAKGFLGEIADPSIEQKKVAIGGGRNGKRKNSDSGDTKPDSTSKSKSSASNKVGAWKAIGILAADGYMSKKRRAAEIQKYCEDERAWKYSVNEITSCLKRMVASQKLKRERDSDQQYVYFTP